MCVRRPPTAPACSDGVKDLISRILVADPHRRLSLQACAAWLPNPAAALMPGARLLLPSGVPFEAASRLDLPQDILTHPWFVQDLHPDALACNEAMVQESQANLPSPEMLREVRAIVQEACPLPSQPALGPFGTP